MKTIVVSAVNIVEAGPLTILKACLATLSRLLSERDDQFRVIAVVHDKQLAYYPNITYIETRWPKKSWINRLWFEYVSLYQVSKEIGDVYLWFSLHDTSPRVKAKYQAVYCHNALFDYRWKAKDLMFAPKMAVLAMLTKYIYKTNILHNNFLVVQQTWLRTAMSTMFSIDPKRIIIAPPAMPKKVLNLQDQIVTKVNSFIYAGSPNKHKNFEVICRAAEILFRDYKKTDFKVCITIKGDENKYAKWLYKNWGHIPVIQFIGFLPRRVLIDYYNTCDCLIFPSLSESWGLPISEFAVYGKYMLLADLPYAHETAGGSRRTAFFEPEDAEGLAALMCKLMAGEDEMFLRIPRPTPIEPFANDWEELFGLLLGEAQDYEQDNIKNRS